MFLACTHLALACTHLALACTIKLRANTPVAGKLAPFLWGVLGRIREKFENEIRDLEQSEKQTNAKYTETKSKLLESEDTIIALRANVKLLEKQLKENREVLSKMTDERSQLKDIVRKEMKQDLSSLEKEVARLKEEKDKELQQVYSR
ncbi:hypothetical protein QE152_g35096 [Popillia japonica]